MYERFRKFREFHLSDLLKRLFLVSYLENVYLLLLIKIWNKKTDGKQIDKTPRAAL